MILKPTNLEREKNINLISQQNKRTKDHIAGRETRGYSLRIWKMRK